MSTIQSSDHILLLAAFFFLGFPMESVWEAASAQVLPINPSPNSDTSVSELGDFIFRCLHTSPLFSLWAKGNPRAKVRCAAHVLASFACQSFAQDLSIPIPFSLLIKLHFIETSPFLFSAAMKCAIAEWPPSFFTSLAVFSTWEEKNPASHVENPTTHVGFSPSYFSTRLLGIRINSCHNAPQRNAQRSRIHDGAASEIRLVKKLQDRNK